MKVRDNITKFIKSLRLRIMILLIVAGIVPVTLLAMFFVNKYEDMMIQEEVEDIEKTATLLKNEIKAADYLRSKNSVRVETLINNIMMDKGGRIRIININYIVINDTFNVDTDRTLIANDVMDAFKGENTINIDKSNRSIMVTMGINGSNGVEGVLRFDYNLKNIDSIIEDAMDYVRAAVAIALMIMAACSAIVLFFIGLPFKKMQEHIRQLDVGQLDEEDENKSIGFTELNDIRKSMDAVILRLRLVDESREEFVSNVSHELKTPITSVKVLADSLLSQDNIPVEMYKEFMVDIASEIDRESSIINDLLALVRMNKKSTELNVSKVNILELVDMVIKRVKPIAGKRNIDITFENYRPIWAEVDEVKMTMVITNLVENAVKYNVDDGWVRVSLSEDLSYFYLKVSDSGIGIPESAQLQVFDRFYRVDKARSRETGGTGLGLAITKTVIDLHKGEVKVYSKEGEGSIFTVRVPLHYMP